MTAPGWTVSGPFRSDAPLVADLVERSGSQGLRRSIDPCCVASASAWTSFGQEIEAALRVGPEHPALAGALAGEERPVPWLVREFAPETLRDRLSGGVSPGEALGLAAWLLRALRDLHALGLFHGDPSPGNVLVRADGTLRLADAVSSRRLFAGAQLSGAVPVEQEQARDLAQALRLLGTLLPRSPAGRSLAAELRDLLARGGPVEGRALAVERLAAFHGIARSAPLPRERAAPPEERPSVDVLLEVSRTDDDRVAYEAAKTLSGLAGGTVSTLRQDLRTRGCTLALPFPLPARGVAEELRARGAGVTIRKAAPAGG